MQTHTLAIFITVFILLTGCEQVKKSHQIENIKTPAPAEQPTPAPALGGAISIHWYAPKKLLTGEDIHDYEIKQYHISWGADENTLTNEAIVTEPSFTLTGLAEGDYYFSVKAESIYGIISEPSATIKRSYFKEQEKKEQEKTEESSIQSSSIQSSAISIIPIADQRAQQGHTYIYQPRLSNSKKIGSWSKVFGPDEVEVHPLTGELTWQIPQQAASESLHLGIRFQNDNIDISETWVLTLGDGNILYIGPDEEHTTLADGMKAIESGDTLIMRNGHWLHNEKKNTIPGNPKKGQTLPAGSAGAFTTLIAEDPGQVIIDGQNEEITLHLFGSTKHPDHELNNNNWSGSSDYISIAGLTLINSSLESIRVDYAKYVKLTNLGIGVSGEGSRGNSNVYIHESQYILIEGLYIWGHGRYKVAFQQSSNSIVRRSIARIDNYFGGKPIGGYIAYCSKNIIFQNNILVDSDQTNFWGDHNEIINAFGIPATNCHDYPEHNEFKRNLALNVHMGLMSTDARTNPNPTLWEDIVGWDLIPARHYVTGGISSMLSGVGATITNRMTLGEINTEGDYLVYSRSLDSLIENSIFYRTGWDGSNNSKAINLTRIGGNEFFISAITT